MFLPSTGRFDARDDSLKGRTTIRTFGLNTRPELTMGRYDAFKALQRILVDYAKLTQNGLHREARDLKQEVLRHAFSSVFGYLLQIADGPGADTIRLDCLAALKTCPEIKTWL